VIEIFMTAKFWFPVYALAGIYLIWKKKMPGLRMVLAMVLLVLFSDQITQHVLKPLWDRPRPCALDEAGSPILGWLRLPFSGRSGPSFPSSHAVNNFAIAAFITLVFKDRRWLRVLFIVALLIGLARVYSGLHYPSDVVGGAMFGLLFGIIFSVGYLYLEERILGTGPVVAEVKDDDPKRDGQPAKVNIEQAPWNKIGS
jgi:membrane-associated phospholipid phosphatase